MKKKTIRQSKRLIISLFVTFFCLTASAAQAQTALVTIDLQQVKMVQVMDEIENQTKYLFIYDKNMDTGRLVNVHVNKRPVAEALDQMVKGTDVVYEIQGSNIILTVRSHQIHKVHGRCELKSYECRNQTYAYYHPVMFLQRFSGIGLYLLP